MNGSRWSLLDSTWLRVICWDTHRHTPRKDSHQRQSLFSKNKIIDDRLEATSTLATVDSGQRYIFLVDFLSLGPAVLQFDRFRPVCFTNLIDVTSISCYLVVNWWSMRVFFFLSRKKRMDKSVDCVLFILKTNDSVEYVVVELVFSLPLAAKAGSWVVPGQLSVDGSQQLRLDLHDAGHHSPLRQHSLPCQDHVGKSSSSSFFFISFQYVVHFSLPYFFHFDFYLI